MKMLEVGDLHLDTKEIRSTLKLVDNNVVMLKGIYDYLVADEEIKLLTFLGDIQHKIPQGKNTMKETDLWKYWFRKIGRLMAGRFPADAVRILETLEEDDTSSMEMILDGEIYPVFTLKGNHDVDNEVDYTFYDSIVNEGLLINPEGLVIEGTTQINFHNYGFAETEYQREDGVTQVIGLYHDVIATEESPFWVGTHPAYPVDKILDGIDLGVIAHIHSNSDPIFVETESGGEAVAWTLGSMGRTAFSAGQIRDVGYCALIDTDDITQLGLVEIDVIPQGVYFNFKGEMLVREQRKSYADFNLGLDDVVVRQYTDPREDIRNIEGLDEGVLGVCLSIMDEIMEGVTTSG